METKEPMKEEASGTTTNGRRWLHWSAATLAVLVVSLMLLGSVPVPGASMSGLSPSNARTAAIGSPMGTHLGVAASSAPPAAPPPAAPTYTTTTSGTFFTSTGVALPSLSSRPCAVPLTAGVCKASATFTSGTTSVSPYVNASNDPALNLTSKGILAMAYTSYTTSASCAAKSPWTDSQIAFATSSNNGASWSTVSYLGTPDCASAAKYPSSWQPALTSLANGTLVLAYIQYNGTAPGVAPFFTSPPLSRLVVSLSYSNGASWTQPTVVNVSNPDPSLTVSFPPMRPSITAFGKTIYLTWMNLGSTVFPQVVSHVAMVVSTTGGKSWSPTITLDSATSYSANPNVAVNPTTGQLYVTFDQPVNYCGVGYFCPGYPGLSTGSPYSTNVVFATSTVNGTGMTYSTVAFGVRINQTYGPFFNPAPVLSYGAKWKVLDLAFVGGVTPGSGGGTTGAQDGDLYFYSSTSNGLSWSRSSTASSAVYSPSLVWGGLTNSTQILSIGVTPMYSSNLWLTATVFNGTLCAQTSCGVVENVALNTSNNGTTWSTALNTSTSGGKWLTSGPFVQSPYVMGNGTNGSYRAYLTGEYDSAISYGSTMLFAWANATCPSWTTPGSLTPSIGECGSFTGSGGSPSWTLWGTSTIQLSQVYTGASTAVTFTPSILPGAAIYHLFVMGNEFRGNGSTSIVVSNVPTGEWVYYNYSGPGPWNATTEFVHGSSSPASPKVFTSATTVSLPFQELVPIVVNTAPSWLAGHDCSVSYTGFGCPLYYSPYTSAVVGSVGWPGPLPYPSSDLDPYGCYFNYCYSPLTGAFTYNGPAQFTCAAYLYPLSMFSSLEAGYEYEYLACVNAYVSHNTGSGSNWQAGSPIPYGSTAWAPVGKPYALNVSYWSPWNVLCGQNKPPYPPGLRAGAGSGSFWYWEFFCYGGDFNELVANAWFGTGPGSVTTQIASGASGDIVVTPTGGAPVMETVDWKVNQQCTTGDAYYEQYGYGSSGSVYTYSYNQTSCHAPTGGGGGGVQVPLTINETGLPKGVTWGVSLSGGGKTFNNTAKGSVLNFPSLIAGTTYTVSVNTVPDPLTGLYWVGTTNATVTMPDFNGITVVFSQRSLSGMNFASVINASGLPTGEGWTLSVTNSSGTQSIAFSPNTPPSAQVANLLLSGGVTYSFNGSTVTATNGTSYYVASVNASIASTNFSSTPASPWLYTMKAVGSAIVTLTYAPEYYLTVQHDAGGTVSVASQWVQQGQGVTLIATPDSASGYVFAGWIGIGNGSSGTSGTSSLKIVIHPTGPVTEFADFRLAAAPTYHVTVQSTGLPAGMNYSVTIGGRTFSGVSNFVVANLSSGSYPIGAPITYSSPTVDTRYVPTALTSSFGGGSTILINANGSITVSYSVQYLLTISNTTGGTVTSASGDNNGAWVAPGTVETLTANPSKNYHFVSWTGTVSGTTATISVPVNSPVIETAQFLVNPISPPRLYLLTATETGLPTGVSWNATVGVNSSAGSTAALTLGGLNGSYTLTVPTIYGQVGTRYVPNSNGIYKVSVVANQTQSVVFTTEYLVTVSTSGGGTATPTTEWVVSGTTVDFAATADPTWVFQSWNGTVNEGTTATTSLSVTAPVTLTATFSPNYHQKTVTSSTQGAPIALGLLAALLVVGLVVGFVLSRRGGGGGGGAPKARSARPMEPEAAPSEEPAPAGEEPMPEEAPLPNGDAMWEEPPAPADMNNDGMSD